MYSLGVDTGGTFTDFVLSDGRRIRVYKIPSTPQNPAAAFLKGVRELCHPAAPLFVTHGSTVATNALLERKGARVALVTTAGFESVLEIGRQNRPSLYDFEVEKPPPLVSRENIFGVHERALYDGTILNEPEKREIEAIAEAIIARHCESVAICFLHSYANPKNERLVEELIERSMRERCGNSPLPISVSHRVLPEYREYERFSTTTVNAYVSPKMSVYLGSIEKDLPEGVRLRVMQSNGGSMSASAARKAAAQTILSGPAGGVIGAFEVARTAGFEKVITLDMGGTSTDVGLCDGSVSLRTRSTVAGCPIGIPVVDIHTVGAGGGSIAWLDSAGSLRVGPQSAGAEPGPVCYGQGRSLTVTDANLCLGRLCASRFLGGRITLDFDRANEHMLKFANDLGIPADMAAEGILRVANATMERAIRVISVERGHDPRNFSLVAFGGAGPMHACDLARALCIPRIVIPRNAGVLSAFGLLIADVSRDFSKTVLLRAEDTSIPQLDTLFSPLEEQALEELTREGFSREEIILERRLDARYVGQSYEVTIPAGGDFLSCFHSEHLRLYGHSNGAWPVEIVNVRLAAAGRVEKPQFSPVEETRDSFCSAVVGKSRMVFGDLKVDAPIYDRSELHGGNRFRGPALVVEMSATTVVTPEFEAGVDSYGNIIMTRSAGEFQ
ncbi:hydantoinase/oxoprolinase family protein [Candidatus Poribacteria bacterium]|nr:hydantoinase/oxoprolinase family protein [Candidatus Poribacteria bacterium]